MMLRKIKILIAVLVCAYGSYAQTITSIADGPFTDPNTWDCTCVPATGAHPYPNIVVNHVVTSGGFTMLGSPGDLTVNGTLTITSGALVSGNWGDPIITIGAGGTIDVAAGQFRMKGADGFLNNGTLNATNFVTSGGAPCAGCSVVNNGTINLSGDFTHNVARTMDMTNGTLNVGGTFQIGASTAVLNATNTSINVTGDLNVSGSGIFNHSSGDLTVGGDFNNTGSVGVVFGSTVDITGNANNTGSSNMTFESNSTIGGNVIGTGGTEIIVNGSLDVTGGIDISGSADLSGNGVVGFGSFNTDNSGSQMECSTGDNHDTDGSSPDPPPPHNPMDLSTCGPGVILPVELLFFNATDGGDHNLITWATVTEENNASFTILRSDDGESFYPIGQLTGAGNSQQLINYSFIDDNYSSAYYQLLQTDFDGQTAVSNIVFVNIESGIVSVYPNPNSGEEINISFGRSVDAAVLIKLHDVTGHELMNEVIEVKGSIKTVQFSNVLATGVYILSVNVDGEVSHFRVVVK